MSAIILGLIILSIIVVLGIIIALIYCYQRYHENDNTEQTPIIYHHEEII